MKAKVTIEMTIDPSEWGTEPSIADTKMLVREMINGDTDWPRDGVEVKVNMLE